MSAPDDKWIEALRPYWGGGIVPVFTSRDGTVNAEKTMEHFAQMHGLKKIGPNGEDLEWPQR